MQRRSYCIYLDVLVREVLLMKVGFHVYLMAWFAELCLNVDGNEDWHIENRLCRLSPPQVHTTARAESHTVSQPLSLHLSLHTVDITCKTLYILNAVCIHLH